MRATDVKRLCGKYILPELPNFAVRDSLLYAKPIEQILQGFSFESSAFDRWAFNVWAFVQPLYVPSTHIVLTMGKRLTRLDDGGDRWWQISESNEATVMREVLDLIRQTGLSFLDDLRTPQDLARNAMTVINSPEDYHVREATAYSLVIAGDYSRAQKALALLSTNLERESKIHPQLLWLQEMTDRVHQIRKKLLDDPEEAVAVLDNWRAETVRNLHLSRKG